MQNTDLAELSPPCFLLFCQLSQHVRFLNVFPNFVQISAFFAEALLHAGVPKLTDFRALIGDVRCYSKQTASLLYALMLGIGSI